MNRSRSNRRLSILHIILALKPTNGQYNEHCLPLMDNRDISICTFFKSDITPPEAITLFDGDNTIMGFIRTLRSALFGKEYDVIHVHTPHAGVLLLVTLLVSGLYGKLISSSVHTVQNSYQNFKLRNKLLFIPSFAFFPQMVFCGAASYESFPAFYKWLARGRMAVVPNAVDLDRIDRIAKPEPASRNGHFAISTVGLISIKNPLTVFQAFRQSADPTSQLTFLGDGSLRPVLAQEVENLGLQKQIHLTGMIARDKVFEYFRGSDIFVSASLGEGLPVAVLEAMACSRPVVLSDIPPHREIAEGLDFIPLVRPDDVAGFARAIREFSTMSTAEREAIGRKCRNLVEERYSLPAMHAGYAEIYARITGNSVPAPLN